MVCLKWGKTYGPEYVNKLFNMVSRNFRLKTKAIGAGGK